jgi:hypothetical protein
MNARHPVLRTIRGTLITTAAVLMLPALCSASQIAGTLADAATPQPTVQARDICPGIDAALQEALAGAYAQVGSEATLQVLMRVEGRRVRDLKVRGGLPEYRRLARHAIFQLGCDSGSASAQTLSFSLAFVAPGTGVAEPRMAGR